ncbi:MAG: hypothetical protein WCS37_16265 [Chloroflexota bacterium]
MLKNILKWARRDGRVALLLAANIVTLVLVVIIVVLLLSPRTSPITSPAGNSSQQSTTTPFEGGSAILAPTSTAEVATTFLPPTLNPTRLSSLPNQGRSDAPPPPAGQLAKSSSTPLTPTSVSVKMVANR